MDIVVPHEAGHNHTSQECFDESHKPANMTRRQRFLSSIGYHELFQAEMWRAAMTELVATTCFLYALTTSIVSCLNSHESDPKLLIPFVVFIIVFLFLIVTVPLSGGHMSPVFTFAAALKGVVTVPRAIIYMLAQCLGAIISSTVIMNVMNPTVAKKYYFGGCMIDGHGSGGGAKTGVSAEIAFMLEFTCTFVVLYIAMTVAFDKRKCKELGLVLVCGVVAGAMAVAVFVSIMVTGKDGYTGVGLSPARCLGPALLHGGPLWNGHWVFWVGPFVACIVYHGFTMTLPKEGFRL